MTYLLLGKYNVRLSREEKERQHEDRNGYGGPGLGDQVKMFEGFLKAVRKTKAREIRRVNQIKGY